MNTELTMLVFSALLTLVLAFPRVAALVLAKGLPIAAGNRDVDYPLSDWAERAGRAHSNMIENLPVFAVLVLVAHVAGVSNETTALGATLFLWGRVAHAVIYIAGIAYLRTAAFGVSLIGLGMIALEIL